ncbi:MAG: zeta toxin family protein [Desulfobacteraceae bacterium]|jgi:predicted ABC-type ATPase
MISPKQLWVLAGGNGAGKSTFYMSSLLSRKGFPFINADMIAKHLNPENPEQVSYEAASLVERIRDEILTKGISFCFETVFSHESKIDFIAKAKSLGYQVILVYIHLDTLALNEARVHQRISEGGHSVPTEKIRSRLPRTMKNVAVALQLADEARLLDNSYRDKPFQQVALIRKGGRIQTTDPLPCWAKEMLKNIP